MHVPENFSQQAITKSLAVGAKFMMLRQVLMQGLNIGGSVLLARLLTPSEFGFFAVVTFFLAFLVSFGDAGLAASLVREEDEPSESTYSSVFTFQLLLVTLVAAIFWFFSPLLVGAYGLPASDELTFKILSLTILVTVLIVVPMVRLERRLLFNKIAVLEVFQGFTFNICAVLFAWLGYGALSFAIALLVRALLGALVVFLLMPWVPKIHWDWHLIQSRVRFGLHYQGVKAISLVKDSISPVLIGMWIGTDAVGYVNWANMVAAYPVMALFVLQRIYMPTFSKLQSDRLALGQLVEKVIWGTNAIAAPLAIITLCLASPLTEIVFGEQWLRALSVLYLFWGANLFVPSVTPCMGLLDAVGKAKVNFKFAVIWMLTTWMLGVPLMIYWGIAGFAFANLIVQFSNLFLYRAAQREAPFKIFRTVFPVWLTAISIGGVLLIATFVNPVDNFVTLIMYGLGALTLYIIGLYTVCRVRVLAVLSILRA